ncbi:MAG: hypothetical protein DHS20C18_34870 [Saprospiraceae bacterium]|nr:MAG: hypothetical protein DHS20C18_34870 [Saprospiraceae bacterium]
MPIIMKYASRRSRRRRNPQQDQDKKQEQFFSKTQDTPIQASSEPFFQAKLVLGQPNDKFEKEANSVASRVVSNTDHGPAVQNNAISSVQRYMTNKAFDEKGTNTDRIEEDKKGDEVPMQSMGAEKKPEEEMTAGQSMDAEKKPEEEMTAGQSMGAEKKSEEEMTAGQSMDAKKKPEEEMAAGQSMDAEKKPEEEMTAGQSMDVEKKPEEEMAAGQSMDAEKKPEEEMAAGQSMTAEKKPEEEMAAGQSMGAEKKPEEEMTAGQSMHQKESGTASKGNTGVEGVLAKTKGQGRPLPKDVKSMMEEKFNAKFDRVRIHTGEDAIRLTCLLKAHAFTHGYDIYFNEGKFNANNASGLFLLAHELTHVVQQNIS